MMSTVILSLLNHDFWYAMPTAWHVGGREDAHLWRKAGALARPGSRRKGAQCSGYDALRGKLQGRGNRKNDEGETSTAVPSSQMKMIDRVPKAQSYKTGGSAPRMSEPAATRWERGAEASFAGVACPVATANGASAQKENRQIW